MRAISLPSEKTGAAPMQSRLPRYFFPALSVFMLAIVIAGFWPSYFGPLVREGSVLRPLVIHFHGAVYMGWMALLLLQVALAATGRVREHRKVGDWGILYGWMVFGVGLIVTFAAPIIHVRAGEWDVERAASFLPIPLGDMILFGGFFALAMRYRRQPEIHKRLILMATVALLFAAAGRMSAFIPFPLALAIWLSPILVGIGFDVVSHRRIHPVYWIGGLVFLIGLLRIPFGQPSLWMTIGRAVIHALAVL